MNLELSEIGVVELFAAFAKAQADMGDVVKGAENEAFKRNGKASKYADLSAVIEAVRPALNKHGLSVIQAPAFDGELLSIETWITHGGGGWMRSMLVLKPAQVNPQGIGSAITYGRRYALLSLAGVAPEDDDGQAASMGRSSADTPKINEGQLGELLALADDVGADRQRFASYLKVESLADLPASRFGEAMKALEAKRGAQ